METIQNTSSDLDDAANETYSFPLTFAQLRLWFLDQLEPGQTSYLIPWALRIRGKLNVAAIASSLQQIVARHEIFRTTFAATEGEPMQVVSSSLHVPLPVIDLTHLDLSAAETEARQLARKERQNPIDLRTGPLLRAQLLRLSSEDHLLLLTTHHIVFDGWSRSILVRELGAFYENALSGKPLQLPELPIQYADFAVWQREHVAGVHLDRQMSYWKQQLQDMPISLNLSTDRPRPPVQTYNGASFRFMLPLNLSERLKTLSQKEGITLYMAMLTGFQLMLARYTGQDDIVVGTPIANRNRFELEGIIGLFANALVIRTRLAGDPTFRELLRRVKETALSAYAHEEIPFEQLVQELRPERSLSQSPLFQVLFSIRNTPNGEFRLADLNVEFFGGAGETSKYDLSLYLEESGGSIRGRLEYNTDLFDTSTIDRMAGHYQTLLESAVENPEKRISEIEILSPGERTQLIVDWNDTKSAYRSDACLYELFEDQVARRGDAVAVSFGEQQISYRELNERANQLAHYLRKNGVRVGHRVGLFVERSLEMFVGLLGIQKSGAAYVPLDPAYPTERVRRTLEVADITFLVTVEGLVSALQSHQGATVLLDRDEPKLVRESIENPVSATTASDVVYVIFTSGSTGRPKGVELRHRGVVNLLEWMQEELRLGDGDVFPALASFAFDMSVPELYLALISGGKVALARRHLAADGEELARFLTANKASIVHATPTTWNLLLQAGFTGRDLKRCIGAEPLPAELFTRLMDTAEGTPLYNFYGPTETTVWSTFHHFESSAEPIVIGRPIPNTEIYIVDRDGNPVPAGVPGEIVIGGDGVAKGYLNQPELTAERFILNRFSIDTDARLYRTGDLGRYLHDGRIEFAGRIDHQVKIRGYRIELGEIESTISQHQTIRECVVMVREDLAGDKRLVGYIVPQTGATFVTNTVREWAKQRLPEYMVPSAFVIVERMPLSPNGKVDRRALPAPNSQTQDSEAMETGSPIQELIANIWTEVLNTKEVTHSANFFDLGGHSLLAAKVVARIRASFGVDLPLSALFESPTIGGLGGRVEGLLREQQTLVQPEIEPIDAGRRVGLSFAQQRLWFLDQLEPNNAFYNVPMALRLTGELDSRAMEAAINEIVARHDSLRTTFQLHEGEPVQVITSHLALPLMPIDLSALPEGEREREAQRLVQEEARRPFVLSVGPLFRSLLLKLGREEHVLMVNMHHAISDGWSLGVFSEELSALYEAFRQGLPSPLPAIALTYRDYSAWQRAYLEGGALAHQLDYWKRHLAGAPPSLELPTDRVRPAIQTFHGSKEIVLFPHEVLEGVKRLSRTEGATFFITLLAAFNVLLSRYSGQQDLVVGTASAGRRHVAMEKVIGFFVNTLALRTDVSDDPTFRELMRRVRETTLNAYANQDVPFEKLVEELNPVRDLSRSPLFQVMMIQQNASKRFQSLGPLSVTSFGTMAETAKVDLLLNVSEVGDRLRCALEYNTDLYDVRTIEQMLRHFRYVLESVIRDPSHRISEVDLQSESEQRELLERWNQTQAEYPRESSLVELIDAQTARTPHQVAVVFEGQQLTYGNLNQRANQLAHRLRTLGVGPDILVGVCLERSLEMLIAILGVVKAGGAYLPVDPAFPKDRQAFMLEDAKVPVLLTSAKLSTGLPSHAAIQICLDTEWDAIRGYSKDNPEVLAGPENLAYVLYTSGSTGRPKGVMITHRNLVNFLESMRREPGLTEKDILVAVTTLSFDIAGLELWLPLCVGARVVIASRNVAMDGVQLAALLHASGATMMQATPATWRLLLETGWTGEHDLVALCGGEALPSSLAAALLPLCNSLWNMYGPTETTIWSTIGRVTEDGHISLGHPIANTQILILDRHQQFLPIGVTGELCIGGDGLSRGYLHQAELTAERFILNPFSQQPGARLYKTGDLARRLYDGSIEYVGRVDDQVKIRGFRIEIGEIEAVLARHPNIQQCVVIVREDQPGNKTLAAYLVPSDPHALLDMEELNSFVKEFLPAYMVPTGWLQLEKLPLSANGKIARKNLPAPGQQNTRTAAGQEPGTVIEIRLASIWQEVLMVPSVRLDDDFFDLGGHSLLAAKVVARIRASFGVDLPLSALFESPTIGGLGGRVEGLLREQQTLVQPEIEPIDAGRRVGLSFAQQRLWFLDQLEPNNAFYNVPMALRLTGELDSRAMEAAINEIVARHDSLRTTFQLHEGEPVQVITSHLALPLMPIDLSALPEGEREREAQRLVQEEARRPFVLSVGPLFRSLLLKLGREEHVLMVNMHHAISDGWSLGVFSEELSALYEAFRQGLPSPLPAIALTYRDYSAWQRAYLEGGALAHQLDYWKRHLAGAPPSLELPTDRVRPAIQTFHGSKEIVLFPHEVLEGVKRLSRTEGATFFITLLAAFNVLLSRYSGQQDLVVGTASAGRRHVAMEKVIGFFVNTLALRTDVSDDPTFRELMRRVRETTLNAYANQDVPFEKLVEELNPVRDLSRSPLFQVMMIQQNASKRFQSLGPLSVTSFGTMAETAKVDLLLNVSEVGDRLRCALEYNTDLYDVRTIEQMLRHFRYVLESVIRDPSHRISEVDLQSESEQRELLERWNQTQAEYPRESSLVELIDAQTARTPHQVAVVFEGQQLTYGNLNQRANQLAHRLRTLGVGPDILVGVCLERSLEMLIAILGVVKAGGAYLPVDPAFPKDRQAFMLEDAKVPVLLTSAKLSTGLPSHAAIQICLDTEWDAIRGYSKDNPEVLAGPENLAYVLYTSGSTGRPKGVMITHRNLVNFLESMRREPGLTEKDILVAVTTLSFDIAGLELWLPLCVGARVVIASRNVAMDGVQLAALLHASGATMMQATPATWRLLLETGWTGEHDLVALCGGEALPSSLAAALLPLCNSLWNMYGPTETTIWSTIGRVTEDGHISLGHPIANTQILILDRHQQFLPIGVTGELCIGGDGLSRGYLHQAELTAERFILNPFSQQPGARLYKTGDLARRLYDGSIEYVGRVDDQVKIRGFRIEIGEIEAVLARHPNIQQCVVIVREDQPGNKTLAAYLVPSDPHALLDMEELNSFVKEFLPAYMVPTGWLQLEKLPLSANGKIARKNLPAPGQQNTRTAAGQEPGTVIEIRLASIWQEVLMVPSVRLDDDFFDLGGHSLLAVQMMTRAREAFGFDLPLNLLFQASKLRDLALIIHSERGKFPFKAIIPIRKTGSKPPLFCISRPNANALGYVFLTRNLSPDQPVIGLQTEMDEDPSEWVYDQAEYEVKAKEYTKVIREWYPSGPYLLTGYCEGAHIAFEVARELEAENCTVAMVAILDAWPVENTVSRTKYFLNGYVRGFRKFLALNPNAKLQSVKRLLPQIGKNRSATSPKNQEAAARAQRRRLEAAQIKKRYWPGPDFVPPTFSGVVTLFRTKKQLPVRINDYKMGWSERALGGVDVIPVSGKHEVILREPHVAELAQAMQDRIDHALARLANGRSK